jgi:hypothetical protein
MKIGTLLLLLLVLVSALPSSHAAGIDAIAYEYVELTLHLGEHDPDWVDAYFGPKELRERVRQAPLPLPELGAAVSRLLSSAAVLPPRGDALDQLRREYILSQLVATLTRIGILQGARYSFDEEARRLFGFVPPRRDEAWFLQVLAEIARELPGEGPLGERLESYRQSFHVPAERLDRVYKEAMAECRRRTVAWIPLPEEESFTIEFVSDKPWGGYNWYRGDYASLIQINTDQPIRVDRAINTACHEGYPGHHVYNVLIDRELVRGRGWVEYTVYPLMTPQSFIAEGTANYGVEMAFPGMEGAEFSRRVLYPLAGLQPAEAERYERVRLLTKRLAYASPEVARRLLEGEVTREEAADLLVRWGLYTRSRAEQHVRFIERYRSYVINYSHGEDLVRAHLQKRKGAAERWREFERLISIPPAPSVLGGGFVRPPRGE